MDLILNRYLSGGLILVAVLLLTGCVLDSKPAATSTPVVRPFKGAPVTATLDGQTLIVANHTAEPVYHLVFPSEILHVIEWAPCLAPAACPAEQRIDSGAETRIELSGIISESTEEITVFWWRFLEKEPGTSVPPMEMQEISVVMP